MRRARIKLEDEPMFYHLYNRVAGVPADRPFGPAEKEQFLRLLHRLDTFFAVKVVAYAVMSNHFHIVAYAPGKLPSRDEVCRRYQAYYQGKQLESDDPQVDVYARRMVNISWFMHDLQQQFSSWFNRTRPVRRRGTLWADRFKHTLLGDGEAVWECIKYIEMNPVRAGMVKSPEDYRFCSFGVWSATGKHPFGRHLEEVLLPFLGGIYPFTSSAQLFESLRSSLAKRQGKRTESGGQWNHIPLRLDRRVRYWVDGLVIGSELFVKDMISRHEPHLRRKKSNLTLTHESGTLCCYKRLRTI